MISFDDAIEKVSYGKSKGRPFVIDLTLAKLKEESPEDYEKLRTALYDLDFAPRRLESILRAMELRGSEGSIITWRDAYMPGWRKKRVT